MFKDNIKSLRLANNLSQEQLADELGISRNAVTKWESGVSSPRMGMCRKVADYFGITVSDLLAEKQEDGEYKLNDSEYKMLSAFRELPLEHQALVMQIIKALQ